MSRFCRAMILGAMCFAVWGCDQSTRGAAQTRPAATKPAEPPLLLEDDAPTTQSSKPLADNSRCHVCHMNFAAEELSTRHARAGVGCATCHGQSDAHIADESWASGGNGTAPETMYPAAKINDACMSCHKPTFDQTKHKDFLAGLTQQKQCTQCHGKHRMAVRKCRWK